MAHDVLVSSDADEVTTSEGECEAVSDDGITDPLAENLGDLARVLEQQDDLAGTLNAIVHAAVGTIEGAQHASISVISRRREVVTRAATDDLPRAVDQAQYDTGEGPCLDTLFEQQTARLPDLAAERRWPLFTVRARALGVGSMLAVRLYVRGEADLGALNLFSDQPHAFSQDSEHTALLFAAHAAVALAGAQQQDQLRAAMSTRDLIGQAKGILMERFKVTSDQAFLLLVRASQTSNRKLHEIAVELALSGEFATTPVRAADGTSVN